MNNITKNALEESLKKFLLQKPLDKITISDLTTDCGISRMAFYYHFKDIYDLVEWSCIAVSYTHLHIRFTTIMYLESIGVEKEGYTERIEGKYQDTSIKASQVAGYCVDIRCV